MIWRWRPPRRASRTTTRLVAAGTTFEVDGGEVGFASLADVIRSEVAAGRPEARVALPILYALAEELDRRDR